MLTIATRESPLALWQAHWVKNQLLKFYPQLKINLLGMTTQADKLLEIPLTQVGGKGLFVKELEESLLDGRADIAVHSMKDVPMELPTGLCIPVMCQREDPRDVLVSNHYAEIHDLPAGAVIGTSSYRRQSQLNAVRSDLKLLHLRGNVNTRLNKLDKGEYQAIILAAAGLIRLGLQSRITHYLSLDTSLPAAGQGVLGIECRENDVHTQELIASLNDISSFVCVTAERALCKRLGGGCQAPIAAYAEIKKNKIYLRGLVGSLDGKQILRVEKTGEINEAQNMGIVAAEDLISQGAEEILRCISQKN